MLTVGVVIVVKAVELAWSELVSVNVVGVKTIRASLVIIVKLENLAWLKLEWLQL